MGTGERGSQDIAQLGLAGRGLPAQPGLGPHCAALGQPREEGPWLPLRLGPRGQASLAGAATGKELGTVYMAAGGKEGGACASRGVSLATQAEAGGARQGPG